jgi:ribose transport system substrate-binding protein
VALVGFDENAATLQAILDGHMHSTVVQNPYEYGRASVRLLAALLAEPDAGKRAALLPENGFLQIPARAIRRADCQAFWDDLKTKIGR